MKNIYAILDKFGLKIPDDKKKEFEKLVEENYKTVSELEVVRNNLDNMTQERDALKTKYDTDIQQRDKDLADLQEKLKKAGTDSDKLQTTLDELEELKTTYANEKKQYQEQLDKQKYEFAVKEKVSTLKFTSNAAKKAFIQDVIAEGLKMKDDDLLGFDDFVIKYKEEDAGVFVEDNDGGGNKDDKPGTKPQFSTKQDNKNLNQDKDKEDKDEPKERPLIW